MIRSKLLSVFFITSALVSTSQASNNFANDLSMRVIATKDLTMPATEAKQIDAMLAFWQEPIAKARAELEQLVGDDMKHIPSLEEYAAVINHELEEGDYDALNSYQRDHKIVDENSTIDEILEAFRHAHNCHWTLEGNDDRIDENMALIIYNHATHELARIDEFIKSLKTQHLAGALSINDI